MVNCQMQPMRLMNGQLVPAQADQPEGREGTIAYRILEQHNTSGDMKNLKIRFDGMLSHDITYVNIIQTARMGDMQEFCMPYVLTNCHNSLCAVGGQASTTNIIENYPGHAQGIGGPMPSVPSIP